MTISAKVRDQVARTAKQIAPANVERVGAYLLLEAQRLDDADAPEHVLLEMLRDHEALAR